MKTSDNINETVLRLWNDFDPIGVVDDADNDTEYQSYVRHTVQLLEHGADVHKLREHIEHCVRVNMGLGTYPADKIDAFVLKLTALA